MEFNSPNPQGIQVEHSLAELWSLCNVHPLLPLQPNEQAECWAMSYQGRNINRRVQLKGTKDYVLESYSYDHTRNKCSLSMIQYFHVRKLSDDANATAREMNGRFGAPARVDVNQIGNVTYAYCLGGLFHNVSGPAIRHYTPDGTITTDLYYLLNNKSILSKHDTNDVSAQALVEFFYNAGMSTMAVVHWMYNPYRMNPETEFDFQMRFGRTPHEYWCEYFNYSDSATAPYGTRALGLYCTYKNEQPWVPLEQQ